MENLDAKTKADEDDFFENYRDRARPKNERDNPKVQHTGIVIKGAAERFSRDPPRHKPPSLQERLGPYQDRSYGGGDGSKDKGRDRDRDRGRDRDWGRDRGRGGGRSRDGGRDRGSTYRGGYPKR